MNSKEIARIACEAMEDKKAQDIKIDVYKRQRLLPIL